MSRSSDRKKIFSAYPTGLSPGTDNLAQIESTLRQLDYGSFRMAAMLADELSRDIRTKAVVETRIDALKATPLTVKASKQKRVAAKAAKLLGGADDSPGKWDEIFPTGETGRLSKWGTFVNFGIAEIVWTVQDGMWWPRLKAWHPQHARWDQSREVFRLITKSDGEIDLPKIDEQPHSDGKWVIWCPRGYQDAFLEGILPALATAYVARRWAMTDWGSYCEAHGHPLRKAVVPVSGGTDDAKEEFFRDVANFKSMPAVMCPQGEEGNRYDVALVEATAKTYESFKDLKAALDTDIAILVLGQNLTTEGGKAGTQALGKVQDNVRLDKLKADAGLAVCLRDQVLYWWALYNFGDGDVAPRPEWQVDPPSDELAKATAMKMTGDGITALKLAGVPIDVRAIADAAGIPMFTQEELDAQAAVRAEEAAAGVTRADEVSLTPSAQGAIITVNEARSASGLGPLLLDSGSADPDGNLTIAEFQLKHAAVIGAAADAESGTPKPRPARTLPFDPRADPLPRKTRATALSAAMRETLVALSGHVVERRTFAGFPIAIENPAGTMRVWTDEQHRTTGATKMLHDYGYIIGVQGSDGEEVDVYLGPNENAPDVHVVHQFAGPNYKTHDEDKVMLGFLDGGAAKAAYLAHRNDGTRAFEGMSTIPLDRFKAQLQRRTGTGKIRASALDAIRAMVDAGERHAKTLSAPKRRRYVDDLTDRAKSLAARSLAADVSALRIAIGEAKDLPSLLKRIVTVYKTKLDPKDLARVIEKTRLMAQLAGAASVRKEAHS